MKGVKNLGYKFWVVWAVICASFGPITYLFYPETANRSLEDIDRFFGDNRGIFVFNNKLATQLHRPLIYEEADRDIAQQSEKMEPEAARLGGKESETAHVEG